MSLDGGRREGVRRWGVYWAAGVFAVVAIVAVLGSIAVLRERRQSLPPSPYVTTEWGGERVELHGRVIAPDGSPVAGARVEIVTPGNPHNLPEAISEARSGGDGAFSFPPIQSGAVASVVVRGNGGELTFDRRIERSVHGPVDLGTFLIGPQREVPILVHCRGELVPTRDTTDRAQMNVDVFQMPSGELVVSGYLEPRPEAPIEGARPGRSMSSRSFDLTETELRGTFRLPIGTNRVVLYGSCGSSVTTFEVAATGPVVFEQDLPALGHDSEVILAHEANDSSSCPLIAAVHVHDERDDTLYNAGDFHIGCRRPARIVGLPPTRIEISGHWGRCRSPIQLSPGETTRVTLRSSGHCSAEQEPAPRAP